MACVRHEPQRPRVFRPMGSLSASNSVSGGRTRSKADSNVRGAERAEDGPMGWREKETPTTA